LLNGFSDVCIAGARQIAGGFPGAWQNRTQATLSSPAACQKADRNVIVAKSFDALIAKLSVIADGDDLKQYARM